MQCEHCSKKLIAKEYDDHLGSCEEYKKKLEGDIQKNKFTEVKP